MMGASTYEGVFIAAKAIGNAGTTDKAAVRQALVDLKDAPDNRSDERTDDLVLTGLPRIDV